MLVQDIMIKDFPTCSVHHSIQEALLHFSQVNSQIIPITNGEGILIGILTKNKMIQVIAEGYPIHFPIEPFINRKPVSLTPHITINATRLLLLENNIAHAPVINDEGKPVGIFSTSQILSAYDKEFNRMESQLHLLFENLNFGVFSVNNELTITASNTKAKKLLQLDEDRPHTFDDSSAIKMLLNGILVEGQQETKSKMLINGHSLFIKCYPLIEKNKLIGSFVMMEDLTQLEKTAQELQFSKEWESKLRSVVELAYDGIILVNEKAQITMVNNGFCQLYQVKERAILGHSAPQLFAELGFQQTLKTGAAFTNVAQLIRDTHCLVTILPLKDGTNIVGAICKITYQGLKQLQDALQKVNKLEQQLTLYQQELHEIKGTKYSFADIIGESPQIITAKKEALAASRSKSTVLLLGESGTGKELFAHGIHCASQQTGMFIQVNCAAIPADLLESEFFGYAEGAFTGAKRGGKKGKFELAQNGTLFLDEIGEMPISLQTKLLRVLQEKEFEPVGSNRVIKMEARIIAATNQNLEHLISEGKFREDLYYRLNIMRVEIPPLRQRIEDIPEIVNMIITRLKKAGFHIAGITHSALTKLMDYHWPGNIRELHNVLERAANLVDDLYIDETHLPNLSSINVKTLENELPSQTTFSKIHPIDNEKDIILQALHESNGNKAKASRLLGISRTWLYAKLKSYQIE